MQYIVTALTLLLLSSQSSNVYTGTQFPTLSGELKFEDLGEYRVNRKKNTLTISNGHWIGYGTLRESGLAYDLAWRHKDSDRIKYRGIYRVSESMSLIRGYYWQEDGLGRGIGDYYYREEK